MSSSLARRSNIEITVFGFLVSLTLKGSLDTAYSQTVSVATTWSEMLYAVWVPTSFLLFVFLITLLRFVYGAYRFHEEAREASADIEPGVQLWNIFATLLLFVFFYITGLSIQHAEPFFIGLIVVHLWDLIWFIVTVVFTNSLGSNIKRVIRNFVIIDALTILLLAVTISYLRDSYRNQAAFIMLVAAAADLLWNRKFFFHPEEWRKQNSKLEGQV